jgi:nitroreductase
MDLNEAIAGRRAVREYTVEPVGVETIRLLIADAVQAPSAINEQPWVFTVARDQVLLDRVAQEVKAHLLATTPASGQHGRFRSMLEDKDFHVFYHAPVLVLISASNQGDWAIEDCSLAAENLMLSAYALGLGSCWMGSAQSYFKTPEGRTAFGLNDRCEPVAPIILGHRKVTAPRVARKQPEIHWVG